MVDLNGMTFDQLAAHTILPSDEGVAPAFNTVIDKVSNLSFHELNVRDFGAVGDGTTDDGPAFNAAIAAANAAGQLANGQGGVGVTILVPKGNYYLPNGTSTKIIVDGVFFVGASTGASVITGVAGTLFGFGNGTAGNKTGGLRSLHIRYVTPSATSVVVAVDFAFEISLTNLRVSRIGQLLRAGETATRYATSLHINDVIGTVYNSGRATIDLRYGAGLAVGKVSLYVDGVGYPTNTTDTHANVGAGAFANGSGRGVISGTNFMNIVTGSWDTVAVSGQVITNRFDRALHVAAASGVVVNNIYMSQPVFDYNATGAVYLNGTGGNIVGVTIMGGYLCATDGHVVQIEVPGGGVVQDIKCVGTLAMFAGKNNFRATGNASHISLIDCIAQGANRLAATNNAGASEGDALVMFGSDWSVIGGTYGLDGAPVTGYANKATYGVTVAPTCARFSIIGAKLDGVAAAQQNLQATTTGLGIHVSGLTTVSGVRPNNTLTTPFTIAASDTTMTNQTAFTNVMYVSGGTVTNIAVNGNLIGLTSGTIYLLPGDNWSITYSSAPAVKRQFLS